MKNALSFLFLFFLNVFNECSDGSRASKRGKDLICKLANIKGGEKSSRLGNKLTCKLHAVSETN